MAQEKTVQFIQVTPDELQEKILNGINKKLDELKKEFQPKEPTEYLTRNEVKDLFKVDLSTVHNWTKKGKLKAYYVGGRVYYKRNEVDQLLTPLNP